MQTNTHDTAIRNRLIDCLGISDEKMFWLEWSAGMEYLTIQCMGNKSAIEACKSEPFYWRWFMQQWYAANEVFMSDYAACSEPTPAMFAGFHRQYLSNENICKSYMYYMAEITRKESRKVAKENTNYSRIKQQHNDTNNDTLPPRSEMD